MKNSVNSVQLHCSLEITSYQNSSALVQMFGIRKLKFVLHTVKCDNDSAYNHNALLS